MYLCNKEQISEEGFTFASVDKGLVFAITVPVLVLGLAFQGLQEVARSLAGGIF
jgi:hypothetical protein